MSRSVKHLTNEEMSEVLALFGHLVKLYLQAHDPDGVKRGNTTFDVPVRMNKTLARRIVLTLVDEKCGEAMTNA